MVADIAFSWLDFCTVTLLAFAFVLMLAGIFSAYFGNGKSRVFGSIMIVTGLLIGATWTYLCIDGVICNVDVWHVFTNAFINMLAVLVGASAAVAIFLISVLKS
ncbi:MAG: hypothetical protein MJY64_00190 [archaeon]|nr:hypothetical protein [archaeon]